MKKSIEVATQGRGFLNELFDSNFETIKFVNHKSTTEITGQGHSFLRSIFYSSFFDLLGIIQIVDFKTDCDASISYNRLLNTNKPYYIICENPTALYHYRLNRKNGIYARVMLKKKLSEENLKGIVCISKACHDSFERILCCKCEKLHQIYPLISDSSSSRPVNRDKQLKCLFVSSTFELKSGCEIVEAAKVLSSVQFILVTRISNIPQSTLNQITKIKNITIKEFNLSKEELYSLYDEVDVLLHPTRQDSFALVVLEAIKHGLPILATSIYAIPEMVEDNVNGYLVDPKYWFFDKDKMPNPSVWNHREETIYSHYVDENIVHFLVEKIQYLDENRSELQRLSLGSQKKAESIFSESKIKEQWEDIISDTL